MSRIEELIEELCPEGVEFKELGEVYEFKYGTGNTIPTIGGKYPVYGSNGIVGTHNEYNSEDAPVIGHIGAYAGIVNWGYGKHYVTYNGVICKIRSKMVITKYAYYHLLQQDFISMAHSGSQPFVSYGMLNKVQIPIPPLPIQQEIVTILDTFTALDGSLQAELEARRKQYEHYRNELLNFEGKEVEWKTLGEVCEMKSGKSISAYDISNFKTEDNIYPCFGGNGLRGYVNSYSHNGNFPIIGRQGALCGNVCFAEGEFYATEHAVVVAHNGKFIARFLYYLLTLMNLNQYATNGAQPGLAVSKLEKLKIPIPPLTEQERIVEILDKFDALVSGELPAEIAARRKQYEYYREKLLTFEPLTTNH